MTEPARAPLVFVDTETDGIHPSRKPWEVAVIRREPDGTQTEWQAFLTIDLSTADPFGLRVGRFYERHPTGRWLSGLDDGRALPSWWETGSMPPADETAAQVARRTHGAHWVGAVPGFDTECLAPLLRRNDLTPAWHYHLVDVENLAVGYLAGQGRVLHPPWSSDALADALGLDPVPEAERHTALGDARFAMRVYDRVISDA